SWSSTYTLVNLIFILFLLCYVRCLERVAFLLSSLSLALTAPCGPGGVREHPCALTRTGGTGPASHPAPERVQVSAGRAGAVRPQWTRRNRRRAARVGALRRSAASYKVAVRSLPRTALRRPGGSI